LSTEKIRIQYEVDKKQLDASNKSLTKTAELNDLTQKEVDQTNEKFKDQNKTLAKTNKMFSGLGGQLQSIGNRFTIAGKGAGDLAVGMFKATNATSGASKAMKVLKIAIAGTGIGLLVVALGSLATAFTASEKGQNEFSKRMDQIGVIVGNISDVFASFGDQLISLFNGDGFDTSKIVEAIDDVVQKTGEEVALAGKLADTRAATNELERQFVVKTAELESRVADLRLKGRMEDEFTASQRLAYLNEANDLQNELIETELTIAKARAEEVRVSNTFSKSTKENKDEEARLEAVVFQIEAKRLNQQRTLQREINTTSKQQQAASKAAADATQAEIEAKQEILDEFRTAEEEYAIEQAEKKAEKDELDRQALLDLNIFKLEESGKLEEAEMAKRKRLLADEKLTEKQRELIIAKSEKAIVDIKTKSEEAASNAKKRGLDYARGLVQEHFGDTKSVAVFETGLATKEAAVQAYKSLAGIPVVGPALGAAAAVAATAFGLKTIGEITSQSAPKFERGGKIGGNLHSSGGTLIEAERDEFMMSRKATSKYGFDFMDKVNNLELDDRILGKSGGSINVVDTTPIANQLKNMPQNIMNVDSEGFTMHQRRNHNMISQKLTRYST
jgi:hypothetical protein